MERYGPTSSFQSLVAIDEWNLTGCCANEAVTVKASSMLKTILFISIPH